MQKNPGRGAQLKEFARNVVRELSRSARKSSEATVIIPASASKGRQLLMAVTASVSRRGYEYEGNSILHAPSTEAAPEYIEPTPPVTRPEPQGRREPTIEPPSSPGIRL